MPKVISINKLIEYAFASPQRRAKIIENAINPPPFILDTSYPSIERASGEYLSSKGSDFNRLAALEQQLVLREARSDHEEGRILNALDAIEHVRTLDWPFFKDEIIIESAGKLPSTLEIGPMIVRVAPSAIIVRHMKGAASSSLGVIKPYFGKCAPLSDGQSVDPGVLYATVLHWFTEQQLSHRGVAISELNCVADVFSQRLIFAAKRYKQRRKQLLSLAEEIADRWEPIRIRVAERHSTEMATGKIEGAMR